jgi:hypothetical protein
MDRSSLERGQGDAAAMRDTWRPPPAGPEPATPASQIRRLVEEACNQGNLVLLEELLAPSCRPRVLLLPQQLAAFRAAVPDARWTIEEQWVQDETVVTRLTVSGTFSGPLLGLAPPGRPATVTGVAISRFAQGRLVDLWLQADLLGLLQQLGVMPPLDLTQVAALTQMEQVGTLLAGDQSSPHRRNHPHPDQRREPGR